ncbi:hypothetical protein OIV83_004544 [Microbotryomycetes sp. JL201]|nr:hypothetical protein OIV83_004544 [Microbotryomycetes sp. JL201]
MWPFSSSDSGAAASDAVPASPLGRPLTNAEAIDPKINPLNPQGLKPCCACPETKKARDDCFLKYGSNADPGSDSQDKCKHIVEQHLRCMRSLGFNV